MSSECYSIEQLGDLVDLNQRDPRLAHANECARCRNLLVSMREFRNPAQIPDGADLPKAETFMERFMEDEIQTADSPQSFREGSFFRSLMQWRTFKLRPASGLAFVLLAVLIVFGVRGRMEQPDRFVVRNIQDGGIAQLTLNAPQYQAGGGLLLSWAYPEAIESFEIVFLTSSLDEILRVAAGSDTFLIVAPEELPRDMKTGDQLLWQVQAMGHDRELVRSQPTGIQLR